MKITPQTRIDTTDTFCWIDFALYLHEFENVQLYQTVHSELIWKLLSHLQSARPFISFTPRQIYGSRPINWSAASLSSRYSFPTKQAGIRDINFIVRFSRTLLLRHWVTISVHLSLAKSVENLIELVDCTISVFLEFHFKIQEQVTDTQPKYGEISSEKYQ